MLCALKSEVWYYGLVFTAVRLAYSRRQKLREGCRGLSIDSNSYLKENIEERTLSNSASTSSFHT